MRIDGIMWIIRESTGIMKWRAELRCVIFGGNALSRVLFGLFIDLLRTMSRWLFSRTIIMWQSTRGCTFTEIMPRHCCPFSVFHPTDRDHKPLVRSIRTGAQERRTVVLGLARIYLAPSIQTTIRSSGLDARSSQSILGYTACRRPAGGSGGDGDRRRDGEERGASTIEIRLDRLASWYHFPCLSIRSRQQRQAASRVVYASYS